MNKSWKIQQVIFFGIILLYFNLKLFFSIEFYTPYYNFNQEFADIVNLEEKNIGLYLDKGLIYRYYLEKEFYKNLYPNHLENEHIPQRIFQYLSQDIKKNLISIIIIIILDILILLLLVSMIYELSFHFQFRKLLLLFILFTLFINLLLIERPKLLKFINFDNNVIFYIPVVFDSILIFFTTWFLFEPSKKQQLKPFLDFYFHDKIILSKKIPQFIQTLKEMFIISIISLIITNLFLFPIFYMQIMYNLPFHSLIILLLLFLIIYYIFAYYNVSKNKEENPKISYAISFLGFRIMNNFIQILFFLFFVISLGIIISILIIANNNILQNLNLIPQNIAL